MELLLAQPRGFCAGVDRAIEIVERALATRGAPIARPPQESAGSCAREETNAPPGCARCWAIDDVVFCASGAGSVTVGGGCGSECREQWMGGEGVERKVGGMS